MLSERDFRSLLSSFLGTYLPRVRGASDNTISSYRDAFVLFLRWFERNQGKSPDKVSFEDLSATNVASWLDSVELRCSVSTRNNRLAALKSFCRYAQGEAPEHLAVCAAVLGIPAKKRPQPDVGYLSMEAVRLILGSASASIRDLALLSLMYDLGARVQEVCDLKAGDLRLAKPASARVTGKGGKTRYVPMTPQVAGIASSYIERFGIGPDDALFQGRTGKALTRAGAAYILDKHVKAARAVAGSAVPDKVSPHSLRHSKAMHLLEHGVNLIYIRDFLGHSSVTTTEIYAKANPEMKRKAIEAAACNIVEDGLYSGEEKANLIAWLRKSF